MSHERQSASTTLVAGSSPMRAVPLRWQVSSSWSQISRAPAASSAWRMKPSACAIIRLSLSHQE